VRETASSAFRARSALNALLTELGRGDVLMAVRIDRLAQSLYHLLDIIENLDARGAGFRSLTDPIDTTTPQSRFALKIFSVLAEFGHALIAERTKAGLARAPAEGRRGGNPRLRIGSALAAEAISRSQIRGYHAALKASKAKWLDAVRTHRPARPWPAVADIANAWLVEGRQRWTAARLRAAARAYVGVGRLEEQVLTAAPKRSRRWWAGGEGGWRENAIRVIAHHKRADPAFTNRRLAVLLDRDLGPPNSALRWSESTVRLYLQEAKARGLITR
jgi:hypothetical protein